MKVTPLGKHLGARVDGVDLAAPASASTFNDIEAAFHAHGVIAVSDPGILSWVTFVTTTSGWHKR